jgi:hypothetical protein
MLVRTMTDDPDAAVSAEALMGSEHEGPAATPRSWWVVAGVLALTGVLLLAWASSDSYRLHDPVRGLQQLDMFFLDEPAPLAAELGITMGRPALVVVCRSCSPPALEMSDATVVVSDDESVAAAYGLLTVHGRMGPGYAVVDARGRVRTRTFDAHLERHAPEIRTLVEAAR